MTSNVILMLAQLCIAEIGFPANQDMLVECEIMWAINQDRAEAWQRDGRPDTTILEVSRLYNSVFKCEDRACDTPRMKWVRELDLAGTKPRHWPTNASWTGGRRSHQWLWLRIVRLARQWEANGRKWPLGTRKACARANHYGGSMDTPGKCWRRVNCGVTRQIFYLGRRCR